MTTSTALAATIPVVTIKGDTIICDVAEFFGNLQGSRPGYGPAAPDHDDRGSPSGG